MKTPDPTAGAAGKTAHDFRALPNGVPVAEPIATTVTGALSLCGRAVGRSSLYEAIRRGICEQKVGQKDVDFDN